MFIHQNLILCSSLFSYYKMNQKSINPTLYLVYIFVYILAWGYGIGFVSLIVVISNIGAFLGPCMKTQLFKRILMFCVALAVGTLGATGLLVLTPEVLHIYSIRNYCQCKFVYLKI